MKKIYLSFLFAITVFASCKKSDKVTDEIKPSTLHNVSFNVSGFSQTMVDLGMKSSASVKAESAASHVNFILYCIYNKEGVLVKKVEQTDKTAAGFGSIKEQLPAGSYTLTVAASSKPLLQMNQDILFSAFFGFFGSASRGDAFVKTLNFEVSDKENQANIEVERIVGKLELSIQDGIPSNVAKITISHGSASFYHFVKGTSSSTDVITEDIPVTESDKSGEGSTFDSYILPMRATGSIQTDVTITCFNTKGDVIVNKVIKNVVFETNKKTILSGKLFEKTSNQQSNFQITIPSTWADEKTINF